MANDSNWGGYREPTNAAPVSGPGALSQRTDGALKGPTPGTRGSAAGGQAPVVSVDPSTLTPLGAPSTRTDEPITAGLPIGAGPGPSLPPEGQLTEEQRRRLRSYLPVLIFQASSPDAGPAIKQLVRQLRADLG